MARPREFDADLAVRQAMEIFWEKTYEGAALADLLAGMGIARGSLYKAFKDKKSLYLRALERYDCEAVTPAVDMLCGADPGEGWARILALFDGIVRCVREGDRRGCLLCTSLVGPAAYDPELAAVLHRMLDRMRAGFEAALSLSRTHASLTPENLQDQAHILITHYVGIRVLARSGVPVETLEQSVAALRSECGDPGSATV